MFYFFLHFPLSGPVLTNISLLIIPCMIVYVTNNKEPWTLNLLPESACIVAAILNWVKDPIRLLSAILYLCGVGCGRHQVWVERGGKSFMSSCIWLSIIIVELKWWYIMLLILVYWRELCYSMFNHFHVILQLLRNGWTHEYKFSRNEAVSRSLTGVQ